MHWTHLGTTVRKTLVPVSLIGLALLSFLSGCAPQTQKPIPTAAPAQTAPTPSPTTSGPATAEDAAWPKIVDAARKEGKMTLYSYNMVGDIGIAVSKAFKERYAIQVDIVTGRGAEFIERVKTENRTGTRVADMTEGNALHLRTMKNEGLTLSVYSDLPVLKDKNVWVADIMGMDPQDKTIIIYNFTTYTPWVNTNVIKAADEPKSWKDFLDPKWKSKIVATDPLTSGGLYQVLLPLMREKVIDEDYLKGLGKQDMRFSSALPDEAGIISRGERPVSLRGVDVVYSRYVSEGAPIKALTLNDGTVLSVVTMEAYKGAPHPNSAKVFMNWLMSPEGQTVFGKAQSVASVRKDVQNFLPEAARVNPVRPILLTNEDSDLSTKYFADRYLPKLWGR